MKRLAVLLIALLATCCGASAQVFVQSYNFSQKGIDGPRTGKDFTNTGVTSFLLAWNPAGSLSTCSVQVESSTDGISWGSGDVVASQSCTAVGSASGSFTKAFVRINVTALSGSGGLNVTLTGTIGGTSSGGGITSVTSLPATCTPGQGFQLPSGATVFCGTVANTFFTSSSLATNPIAFGAKIDGVAVFDATITNGSSTVVTASTDKAFVVGQDETKQCIGSSGGVAQNHMTSVRVLTSTTCTITTVNSAHNVTISTTGNGSAAGTATQLFVWGTDDTTAWLASFASFNLQGQPCGTTFVPVGLSLVKKGFGNGLACGLNITGNTEGGFVSGGGPLSSIIVPTMDFDPTTCTATSGGCFFGTVGMQLNNFGIWGAEIGNLSVGFNSHYVLSFLADDRYQSILIAGWGAGDGSFGGVNVASPSAPGMNFVVFDGAGGVCANWNASFAPVTNSWFGDCQQSDINLALGSRLSSTNNTFGVVANGLAMVIVGGDFISNNDACFNNSTFNNTGIKVLTGGFASITGLDCKADATTTAIAIWANGGTVRCVQCRLVGGATGNDIFLDTSANVYAEQTRFLGANNAVNRTSGTFFDNGGNTYTGSITTIAPSCTFTSGGGTTPSCALLASSTNEKGTIIATTGTGSPGTTGTITLTFAGTYAGGKAAAPACTISLDDSGTAWANEASSRVSTQSTTAPIFAWTNLASGTLTALTVSVPYRMDYTCTAR